VGRTPARSGLTGLLSLMGEEFAADQIGEPWEQHYARRLVEHFAA
jgi:hypothetical protein